MMAGRVTRSRRQLAQNPEEQLRARWTNGLTKIFADLLVEQVQRGNRMNNNSFSKRAWKVVSDGFYQKTGLRWDNDQLKNRYAVLKRQFAIVKSLLGRSEFSLDDSTGIVVGSNEAWAQYLKGHPDAEPIKSSGCAIYRQLCVIFSEPVTNGKHVVFPEPETNGGNEQSAEQEANISAPVSCKEPLNVIKVEVSSSESEELDDMADDPDAFQTAMQCANASRKRGRRGVDGAIAAAILQMAAASKLRTAAVRQINARYSIADCIKELDKLQGVEQDVYFSALDLFNKPHAREFFLSLKGDKRLIWLRAKCTARSDVVPIG